MSECTEFKDDSVKDAPVRGFLHRARGADADCLVLTHGAGANCQAPLLKALAEAFCAAGVTVLRCDLPFRQARPHGPPMREAANEIRKGCARRCRLCGGKRRAGFFWAGIRMAAGRLRCWPRAAPGLVERLLLLSYPLHPPKRPEQMRTAHFPSLQTPALFVSGERDGFGSKAEMESALELIPAKTELLMVPGAGHELMTARNRAELPGRVVEEFLKFAKG